MSTVAATTAALAKVASAPVVREKKGKKERKESESSGSPLTSSISSTSFPITGSASQGFAPRISGSLIEKRDSGSPNIRNSGGSEVVGKSSKRDKKERSRVDKSGQTGFDPSLLQAFLEASFSGDEEMVRCALDAGVPPTARDDFGSTALHHACFKGHESIVVLLISRRADVEAKDSDGCTPLHNAAFNGQHKCLEALLAANVRVTGGDVDGATPLHKAAHNGHLECVKSLIARGAAVDAADVEGFTALHRAVLANHPSLIPILIGAGARMDSTDGEGATPCSTAASEGHMDCLRELLILGCSIDLRDSMGLAPVHVAALNGQSDALAMLLSPPPLNKDSASPNATTSPVRSLPDMANLKSADGNTPLHYAAIHGSVAACSVLLKAGADKNASNAKGSTSLHIAAARNHAGVVKYLLKRAVDPTVADSHGKTAAQYASTSKVVRYFDKLAMAAFEDSNGNGTPKEKRTHKSSRGRDFRTPPSSPSSPSSAAGTPLSSMSNQAANPAVQAVREQGVDGYDALRKRSLRSGLSTYKLDKYGFLKKKEDVDTVIAMENALLPSPEIEASEAVKWGKLISKYRYQFQPVVYSPFHIDFLIIGLPLLILVFILSLGADLIAFIRAKRLSESELKKMREMAEAGIPDAVRGEAWKILVQSRAVYDRGHVQGVYQELVRRPSKDEDQIQRDIHRTMPEHYLFRDKSGVGQTQLFNVLKACSVYNTNVGYCQGMGFLVALLLMHLDEEDAFWVLVRLCDPGIYAMDDLYAAGMPGLKKRCFILNHLLEAAHPKLHQHLTAVDVNVTMFVPQWFVTVFLYSLPFPVVLRVFDLFLANGHDMLYYTSLAIFKLQEEKILAANSIEKVMPLLKFDRMDDKQALLIKPQDIVVATIAYRKKWKDKLDKLKKEADQEGKKLQYMTQKS